MSFNKEKQEAPERKAYSVPEFCAMFGFAERTGWDLVQKRAVGHLRIGRRVLISTEAIEEFRRKHTVAAVDGKKIAREILGQ